MSSSADDDWRLQGQEGFLLGVSLQFTPWITANPDWDHDHCEFCYKKLAGPDIEDAEHEAYATPDRYHWVCVACFVDFKDRFQFKVIPLLSNE